MKTINEPPMEHVLESATGVAEGRYAPMYKSASYEDAMLAIAKSEARSGESPAVAFARLCEERDSRIEALFIASRAADHDARRDRVEKKRAEREAPQQPLTVRQKVMEDMLARADREKRAGETSEQAMTRLLDSDRAMQDLYAKYLGR